MITNDFTTFRPAGTIVAAASVASARVALPIASERTSGVRPQVRIFNATAVPAFVTFGDGAVNAAVTDIPIAVSATSPAVIFTVPEGATHAAVILGSGTGNVHFTSGFGA